MNKRKSAASSAGPRKKAKLDHDTLSSQMSSPNRASAAASTSPQRREKRRRTADSTSIESLDEESDAGRSTKRIKTRSQENTTDIPVSNFEKWKGVEDDVPVNNSNPLLWPDVEDDTDSGEGYPRKLTKAQIQWQIDCTRSENGYFLCTCGKYHNVIGRKIYHYGDGSPEPASGSEREGSVEAEPRPNRGRGPLPSPGFSDRETDEDDDQLDAHIHTAVSQSPLDGSDPQVHRTDSPSPIISQTTSALPAILPATSNTRVLRRHNTKRDLRRPAGQGQTQGKKNKLESNKNKIEKNRDQGNRNKKKKSNPTLDVEESRHLRRSSRRNSGAQLWFLDNNGKACLVADSSR